MAFEKGTSWKCQHFAGTKLATICRSFFMFLLKTDVHLLKGGDKSFKIRFVVKLISFALGFFPVER